MVVLKGTHQHRRHFNRKLAESGIARFLSLKRLYSFSLSAVCEGVLIEIKDKPNSAEVGAFVKANTPL